MFFFWKICVSVFRRASESSKLLSKYFKRVFSTKKSALFSSRNKSWFWESPRQPFVYLDLHRNFFIGMGFFAIHVLPVALSKTEAQFLIHEPKFPNHDLSSFEKNGRQIIRSWLLCCQYKTFNHGFQRKYVLL